MIKNASEYPRPGQMKRNRLEKLKEANGKCEVCGEEAKYVHHLDESKDNHKMDNLAALCMRCHSILHADRTNLTHHKDSDGNLLRKDQEV